MSKESSELPDIIVGKVRVECRVAVWAQCPLCHQEHSHILSAHDHHRLSGLRYWRVDCQGTSYFLRVSSDAIATAVAKAAEIAAEHGISQHWLSEDSAVNCCACIGTE